ncbi:MAG: adenylyl-sulfate kinase [Flavobacteriaceae bacterium]|nr:adenylyl-sulfate kinase [Flavobacteriaceae bacterium]
MKKYLVDYTYQISKAQRTKRNKHKSLLIWFTGLSGSGKSTLANRVEKKLFDMGIKTYVLDGDTLRKGINKDLSFSANDRSENIRRIAEISNLFLEAGVVIIAAFISPYKADRLRVSQIVQQENYIEIFVNTSLEECEKRDVKGLYKKARSGEISHMTGISAPYEIPESPDIEVKTESETEAQAVARIIQYVTPKLKL